MSLRARLLVGLVVLVAAGLAAAGFATYTEQRSFLYNRVDQTVIASASEVPSFLATAAVTGAAGGSGAARTAAAGATGAAGAAAAGSGSAGAAQTTGSAGAYGPPAGYPTTAGGQLFGPAGGLPGYGYGGAPSSDGDGRDGGGANVHGQRPDLVFPSGTFAEHLNAAGTLVGSPIFSKFTTGVSTDDYPSLPKHYPVTTSLAHPHVFTAGSKGGSSQTFRVVALSVPAAGGGGTTIVAVPLSDATQTLNRLLLVEALVAGAVLLALVALAWVVIRFGLRPLERMGRVADEIAGGDLSRRVAPATPRTEVGRLGLALNEMLVTIEQAFADRRASEDRLRRFLSDASHELRTPLASIRGYAELFRLGAASEPADLAKAMERIESEAARMGVLVEELLMLARLDELPETSTEAVELTVLAERAVADARAIAPDRSIEWHGEAPAVAGDPNQLHQVLANLLRNAISHTPAGTAIEVSVGREGAYGELSVRDHGPGLPEGVADRIFERFWRSEGGRTRGRSGAGLGLAIVQGIVRGHDGEVHASNAPDGGACFRVLLPLAGDDLIGDGPHAPDGRSQPTLRGATG